MIDTELEIGETARINLGDGTVLSMRRLPQDPEWSVGAVVTDREKEERPEMIIVGVSSEPIKNINVGGINTYEANKQYGYSGDCPTVYAIYKDKLLESIGDIPEDIGMFFSNQKFRVLGVKAYPFPSPRLVKIK